MHGIIIKHIESLEIIPNVTYKSLLKVHGASFKLLPIFQLMTFLAQGLHD